MPHSAETLAAAAAAGATEIVQIPCAALPGLGLGFNRVPDPPDVTYAAAIAAGLAIASTGTPSADGTYALDLDQQQTVSSVALYIAVNSRFPGDLPAVTLRLAAGGLIEILATTLYQEVATAIADYVAQLDAALLTASAGAPTQWPPASVTIA